MRNAIYLDYGWFSGDADLTDDQRNDYIYLLQDHGITQQFCDIGVIREDGTLSPEGVRDLKQWIYMSRLVDPCQEIILVLNYGRRKSSKSFGTASFNEAMLDTIHTLIALFSPDGFHLDIEGFLPNDLQLLKLLKLIKRVFYAHHLSISTPATVWTDGYIRQVAAIVDQMNPMIYDTMGWGSEVVDETSYKDYFKDKIVRYARLLAGTGCELVPTLPVYELKVADDRTIYHDPVVETMKAAIEAIEESQTPVDGAAIFWGSFFLGLYPEIYNPDQDQHEWRKNWIGVDE